MKIVHVDDSEIFRESLKRLLFDIGQIEIKATADGVKDGIELIKQEKPELLILDFQLKDGTAIDILKIINTDEIENIIVLSNYGDDLYKQTALKYGATQYFDKNNDMFELLDFLKEATSDN